MLGNQWFYYRTLRKIVNSFGSLFNGIDMVSYNYDTMEEIKRITVPLTFEGKENYMTRLLSDPDLTKGVQIQLPRMSYDFKGLKYRPDRRQTMYKAGQLTQSGNNAQRVYTAAPYDVFLELYLYNRNMEDGLQIIEQILPTFAPDYSLSLKYLTTPNPANSNSSIWVSQDLPIVLQNIDFSNEYEGGAGKVRLITWTLQFNAKAFFYAGTTPFGVIKDVIVTLKDSNTDISLSTMNIEVNPITANISDSWNVNTTIVETS